ncbi:MAG: OprO/OprP family phosphate-selective porin [Bacteroidales bacterium]|nr:OprO/OprP family phosphate-selective porin [Bacteroidales bacterium]
MKNQVKPDYTEMKRLLGLTIFTIFSVCGYSQNQAVDSLKEVFDRLEGKINALDERVLVNEADLGKLNKIKVSGYVQAQWENYGKDLVKTNDPANNFYIRRARVKFMYEPLDGIKFVIQPDFSTGSLSLKDAYAVVNIPKLKNFTLWAGQFNRPDYEVEYSSNQREVLERSRIIRAIYPGEREIGVKLEYIGSKIPLKFQLMAMNGNFTGTQAKDYDSKKDLMGRLVYSIKLPDAGLGIDLGANGYFGGNRIKYNTFVSNLEGKLDSTSFTAGDYLDKNWAGGEIQIFADILGGMAFKGEYVAGVNSASSSTNQDSKAKLADMRRDPIKLRNFSGYYIYLIKNIGPKNQFVAKYDYYDPNTKLSGDAAKNELFYKTFTLAWQYYLNDNIRLSFNYELPKNETNSTNTKDLKDNTLGVRIQAKF